MAASTDFQWPWQYSFPPFFTLQPNEDTRAKQIDAWCQLILDWKRYERTYSLDVDEFLVSPVCANANIDRRLSRDFLMLLLRELEKRGNVEWMGEGQKTCRVMWRTPAEWARLLYDWVNERSMMNTVCTLYELTEGPESEQTEFFKLDKWLLMRALKILQSDRKAEIMQLGDSEGVKFF